MLQSGKFIKSIIGSIGPHNLSLKDKDKNTLPEFFDFILKVEEVDNLSYSSVGKQHLEFVKGPIFSTRPVLLELTEILYWWSEDT